MNTQTISIDEIKSVNEKREKLNYLIAAKDKEAKSLSDNLAKEKERVNLINNSIKLEKILKKLPCQAFGSVTYYNTLNEKFDAFNSEQFNKITRFIELIENTEIQYRNLYLQSTNIYLKDPNQKCHKDCQSELQKLQYMYGLMSILTNEVDKDKVKFHKTYNLLEDKGIFLTANEKNLNTFLLNISGLLNDIKEELKSLNINILENNLILGEISGNIDYSNDMLFDISFDVASLKS